MALTTRIKGRVNALLRPLNLRLDTLTAERQESLRLQALDASGHFDRPVFPMPSHFSAPTTVTEILARVSMYRSRFDDFVEPSRATTGYTFANDNFTSPDAEVLYAVVSMFQPETVVEVGCGHSSRLIRQAILDGGLTTRFVGVDPRPRIDVAGLHDEFYQTRVEQLGVELLLTRLDQRGLLFIDSSHRLRSGNDVSHLYLCVLPSLPVGTLVHIHDVFLPYEYPRGWVLKKRWEFTEQYLVQVLLTQGTAFEVLWPGHFLHRTRSDFGANFPHSNGRMASSLWLRKCG